ncbi:hypothetical protein M569_15790 [Genlisea aurea]|uniref:NAC domain-containing protein n=1 Tax=Genlisea aurea TaxID=192259 RepID=S8C3R0_9LAMI|nr:hypothetical protein M569_15790 [Genlisea aurea]
MNLAAVEAELPPGFRFHPKDDELICDYLGKWVIGDVRRTPPLIEVDVNNSEPWNFPEIARVGGKDWYFYSRRDRKYATGERTNRATISGYWKATGKDRTIHRKGLLVGSRKTLVFYHGRAPNGRKTDWIMHEFRLHGSLRSDSKLVTLIQQENWVLCRVFYKKRDKNKQEQLPLEQVPCFSSWRPHVENVTEDRFRVRKLPEDKNEFDDGLPVGGLEPSIGFPGDEYSWW